MGYKLNEANIDDLQWILEEGGSIELYYVALASMGDGYGDLAAGVVGNDSFSGKIANAFAWSVTNSVNPALAQGNWDATWKKISEELAQADFQMRLDKYNRGLDDHSLSYREIQQYHNSVFAANGLPAEAWTAEIVLNSHPNPEQWWNNQLSQSGIVNLTAYMDLFNQMVALSGAEADAHRHEWYNADGTINDATANSSAWMIDNMPITFWSQHLYSPTGIGAAATGFLESLASGVAEAFSGVKVIQMYLSDLVDGANDILGYYLYETSAFYGLLVEGYMDETVLNNSTVTGVWGMADADLRSPNNGDMGAWIQLTRDYRDFSLKYQQFMSKIQIRYDGEDVYVDYRGDFPGEGETVWLSTKYLDVPKITQDMIDAAVEYFWNFFDPVVLDLDGDGIETIALSDSSSSFLDPAGSVHGWLSADDAFLFIDRNNDGVATNGSELFGSSSERGFDALKRLDANNDSVLDQSDPMFASLRVWRDLDGNGVSSLEEVYTLDQLNIKSFNLAYVNEPYIDNGNFVADLSSYEMTDGSRKVMADVWFAAA
ncbi:hypothetical protein D3C80_206630 [compost metagenome]